MKLGMAGRVKCTAGKSRVNCTFCQILAKSRFPPFFLRIRPCRRPVPFCVPAKARPITFRKTGLTLRFRIRSAPYRTQNLIASKTFRSRERGVQSGAQACDLSDASVPGRFDQMIRRTECKCLNGECGMIPATGDETAAVHDEKVGYVVRAVVFIYH